MPFRIARLFLVIGFTLVLGSGCMSWMRRSSPTPVEVVVEVEEPPRQTARKTARQAPPPARYTPYAPVETPPAPIRGGAGPEPAPEGTKTGARIGDPSVLRTGARGTPGASPPTMGHADLGQVGQPQQIPDPKPVQTGQASPPGRLPTRIIDTPREPVVAALDCILRSRHQEALAHLKKYDGPTQELFLRLLPAVALMTQKGLAGLNASEVGLLDEQLGGLLVSLRPRTELTIDKACFCSWVKSYGMFKPLPEGHAFVPSSPAGPGELVQLYVELRNFVSELRGEHFETKLSSTLEISGDDGRRIWFYSFEDGKVPLRSRTMLHDWFSNYTFYAPHLPPGTYRLTITVSDETRPEQRRTARRSLEFRVAAVAARIP